MRRFGRAERVVEAYREQTGLPIMQAWGMTETSPVASVGRIKSSLEAKLTDAEKVDLRTTVGQIALGVEFRVVDPITLERKPWDGETSGELQVRGPWIARTYYNDDRSSESFTADGWLKTGDMAVVTPDAYIRLVDRTKDVIKSGGEWISSVDLENAIMGHPKVAEAAVIGVPHPKWSERPLACVVVKPGEELSKEELLDWLSDKVAKWWLPDDVVFIDEVPKTSVGKFSKKDLRGKFEGYRTAVGLISNIKGSPSMTFGAANAEVYDDRAQQGDEEAIVEFLAGYAAGGLALELAIGTGRIALPLAATECARRRHRLFAADGRKAAGKAGR